MRLTEIHWTIDNDEDDEATCPIHTTDYGNSFFLSSNPRYLDIKGIIGTFYLYPTDDDEVHFTDELDPPPYSMFIGIPARWNNLAITYLHVHAAIPNAPNMHHGNLLIIALHHKVVAPTHLWQIYLDTADEPENHPGDPFFIEIDLT